MGYNKYSVFSVVFYNCKFVISYYWLNNILNHYFNGATTQCKFLPSMIRWKPFRYWKGMNI